MKKSSTQFTAVPLKVLLLSASASVLLSACGGGSDAPSSRAQVEAQASIATGTTTLQLDSAALPDTVGTQNAQPAFHVAPVLLDTPDDADSGGNAVSARMEPRRQAVPAEFQALSTRALTARTLLSARAAQELRSSRGQAAVEEGTAAPMANSKVVSTYTPAQIRAAYGMTALPATGAALSAAQAAQLGAGQTIYIVDAMHDPNTVAELNAFNQKFGLPACTVKTISATAGLPLAAASATNCELSVVYNTSSGTMTTSAPAYDSGWATEIALDVQWAHATAPLARIVLIEAADASLTNLLGGVKLANAMGPGVVSMSFGSQEGNWTASSDTAFSAANMTYLAATGDSGYSVQWPAVSTKVLAVGGTTLTYSGSGARSETSWSGTGGGVSAYTAAPSYQTNAVPGMGSVTRRNVADVAFNADPSTGQYLAVMSSGSSSVSWLSAGGTSLSTPQWAGLIAIANATRALSAKASLGAPHAVLYGQISTVPGTYAAAFADVTTGSDGTCSGCTAKTGYDTLTGLGTPNAASLLASLTGATAVAAAPVVTPASISGKIGTSLTFTVSASGPNPLTYSLSGAPAGMTISSTGAVNWSAPTVGSFAVTVIAKDSKTGLSGQGVYTVTISSVSAPVLAGASITGKAGTALSFNVGAVSPDPLTYSLSGAPAGMTISSIGQISWAAPVAGSYSVTAIAKDAKTGMSGQGIYKITIAAATTVLPSGPVLTIPAMNGISGKALTGTIGISDPGATSLQISISGAPMGMSFS
ncbi:S53 family peptidase, partial [Undibacterium sp.]|uniref:S53 family peptidase n=1 Tax=Undibacterium sp. TaxID=1914977 RepID=UPI00374D04E9